MEKHKITLFTAGGKPLFHDIWHGKRKKKSELLLQDKNIIDLQIIFGSNNSNLSQYMQPKHVLCYYIIQAVMKL